MSLKIKLTSTILAFCLILGLLVMGVFATSQATVNLGGSLTFMATNVYAKVTGTISGTASATQPELDDIYIDDETIEGDIDTWASQDLTFKSDGSAITIAVTIENLATDRNLYAYITDAKGKVTNVNKSMKQGEAVYKDTELITLDYSSNKTATITLSMEIDDKNTSLAAGTLYGYEIHLMDISGIDSISDQETKQKITFKTDTENWTASVMDLGFKATNYDPSTVVYVSTGAITIPPYVKDADNNVYTVNELPECAFGSWYTDANKNITSVTMPNTITKLGDAVFSGCSSLTSVKLSTALTKLAGSETFMSCNLSSIVLPEGLLEIGSSAFQSNENLTSVIIPDGVRLIGVSAFQGTGLPSVLIPESVTTIRGYAFSGCDNLSMVYYTGTEEQWNAISIDNSENCNDELINAEKHFNYVVK